MLQMFGLPSNSVWGVFGGTGYEHVAKAGQLELDGLLREKPASLHVFTCGAQGKSWKVGALGVAQIVSIKST